VQDKAKTDKKSAVLDMEVLISRSPRMGESELHGVNEHFESVFNTVLCQLRYF